MIYISAYTRPHIADEDRLGPCWCRPEVCDDGCRHHRDVDLMPADRAHCARFSEQIGAREVHGPA